MKILINGLLLTGRYSGVQYSIENLIEALSISEAESYQFTVLVSNNYKGKLKNTNNLELKKVSFDSSDRLRRILFENFRVPTNLKRNDFDIYHSPGYTMPYFQDIPSVVTVHDLIALDFPKLCQNETSAYFSVMLPRAINRSKKIIAVSDTVKKDILNRFPAIDEQKISVIHHGVHPRFKRIIEVGYLSEIRSRYNLPDKFLIFIGNLEPKKNLNRIIQAFCELKKGGHIDHKLIIVGKKGWKFTSIIENAEKCEFQEDIRFLGYIDENDLVVLYSLAELLLFPSLYEGFGLPVIEAMACGCPVIVSDRGSLPEISGGNCRIVNPENVNEIAVAILDIVKHQQYRDFLVNGGYSRSADFTWDKAATKALGVYDSIGELM